MSGPRTPNSTPPLGTRVQGSSTSTTEPNDGRTTPLLGDPLPVPAPSGPIPAPPPSNRAPLETIERTVGNLAGALNNALTGAMSNIQQSALGGAIASKIAAVTAAAGVPPTATGMSPPQPTTPTLNHPNKTMPPTTVPSIGGAAAQPQATSHAAPQLVVQYPEPGSILKSPRGNYAVLKTLGAGAFGAVYEAVGPFDQVYALKMMRPANRPYAEVQAEWAKEVQRLMSLRHPNVVYIYDAFTDANLFYLALERCDHALNEMLGTPMQEGLVIELTRQLLAAVQFLHDNDVVHDDLHAGNVLITHTDRPQVKISDFGISHELRGMPSIRPNVVHHAIMAPEILATGFTSKQSDIYQVGLLIYWMLTGSSAIQMDVPYAQLAEQVASGEPRKKAEALGTPLGALIAKMLRRRESFRYAAAREVWADLRQLDAWKNRSLFPIK